MDLEPSGWHCQWLARWLVTAKVGDQMEVVNCKCRMVDQHSVWKVIEKKPNEALVAITGFSAYQANMLVKWTSMKEEVLQEISCLVVDVVPKENGGRDHRFWGYWF